MGIKILWILGILVASGASLKRSPARSELKSLFQRLRRETQSSDPHLGDFCVDVSTYGEITFTSEPRNKCDTTFEKQCEDKTEQICDEVTEMQCEIVPYTDCAMSMDATPYKTFKMVPQTYKKKVCKEGMDVVKHTKMMPDCYNVTKQNCITKWEEDENGKKVWAGNEACQPVTWSECKLVPRQVDFKVPKITCEDGEEIPYTDMEPVEDTQMTTKMTCEVKHTSDCKPVTSTKCNSISFQECAEVAIENCEEIDMKIPGQEREHKQKCLLPDVPPQGTGAIARGGKTLGSLVAVAKAQAAISEAVQAEESIRSFAAARPLPLRKTQQPRQGRTFQQHQKNQNTFNNRRGFQPQQGQFVRGRN